MGPHLYEVPRRGEFTETDVDGGAGAAGGEGEGVSRGQSVHVGRRTILESTVVVAAQQCDCP